MSPVLFLNGTVGSGKTTTAEEIGALLAPKCVPHAIVDFDWLRNSWPAPEGDHFNTAIGFRNLAAVWANFREAGAQRLVVAGVLETSQERRQLEDALGVRAAVCRLVVSLPELRRRLQHRHSSGASLEGYLRRAPELHAVLSSAGVDDQIIEVREDTPRVVAARVLTACSWT